MTNNGASQHTRWERLHELFSRAIDLPEGEREAFVRAQCAGDESLREELLELLAADSRDASDRLLTGALGAAIDATTRDRREAMIGALVGNYRLTSVLGHGGTGTVYLAERADRQYSAQVAVKIVDNAIVHGELGLRFRAERQILASLNHANIARLIDAGETKDGRPYLVMEYVHGEPVDRYCDSRRLDLHDRLTLFLEICNAVQYAHQNLVVHRDLKPANILVTAEGSPKLLDFGIAKLLDAGEAAAALALTRLNDRLLTPEYASPEQILGRPVTTASDVYALGVVLYELLTGLRPYTVSTSASQLELERSICITDPPRPSAAVRRSIEGAGAADAPDISLIAHARNLTADRLQRKLQGDLDAIVMRALRKEPERRYASVEQLAADVRRYLAREPVHARQGNWLYYSQRFVRRHAYGVSAAAAFLCFVVTFAVVMSLQAQRIAAERDRAEQESERAEKVSEFMLQVFSASDPFVRQGAPEMTARELLDKAGRDISTHTLDQHPEVRARLLEAIGKAYRRQNAFDRSIQYLEEALRIRAQMPEEYDPKTPALLAELAIALRQTGNIEESNQTVEKALALIRSRGDERSPVYATLLMNLGRGKLESGDLAGAQQYFEKSLALYRELLGQFNPAVASVLTELSTVAMWRDDFPEAERAIRGALDIYRANFAEMHPDRVLAEYRLAEVLLAQGRLQEAAPLFEALLESQKRLYGPYSRQVADIFDSLATIRRSEGLLEEAEEFARRAVQTQAVAMGEDHYMTGYFRTSLAGVLIRRGAYREAEEELRLAMDIYGKTLPPDHQYVASAEHLLGEALLATNRLADAESALLASMNRWKRAKSSPWRSARSASVLGEVLYRMGRYDEAERYLTQSYRTIVADPSADRETRAQARKRVERFYTDRGEREKLAQLLNEAMQAAPPVARRD